MQKIPICFTGGAKGCDTAFEFRCKMHEMKCVAYTFEGHTTDTKVPFILNDTLLSQADKYLLGAAHILNRKIPYKSYVKKLLQRNVWIIDKSEMVIAFANLETESIVSGGTGWGCAVGQLMNKPVYVFDLITNKWFLSESGSTIYIPSQRPIPACRFAGIGTRTPTLTGINELVSVCDDWAKLYKN